MGEDHWNTTGNLGGPALEFDLTGISGTILSATLSVFYAGLELGSGGDVKINGTSIGSILAPDFQTVALASFANVEALLSDSTTASIAASVSGDGFIVDYMKLDLEVDMPAVPLPASLPLLAVGLGGLGLLARRKRKSA